MATYKVIQDIEAEDKLVGPLTLRQFIYAGIAAINLYLGFLSLNKHAQFMLVLFLPIAFVTGFFAFPWGKDQPTEIWALAKLRFYLKPRRRIWDQSGAKELVTITVPKIIQRQYTNGLNQEEVHSRLSALANTIDSRGWAIKNVNVNLNANPGAYSTASDRLVQANTLPQEVQSLDIHASDDILDESANPIAQQFDNMINASAAANRQRLLAQMQAPAPTAPSMPVPASQPAAQQQAAPMPPPTPTPTRAASPAASSPAAADPQKPDYWFLQQPATAQGQTPIIDAPAVTPGFQAAIAPPQAATPTAEEEAMVQKFKQENSSQTVAYGHLKTVKTPEQLAAEAAQARAAAKAKPTVTPEEQAAIINLSNNDDLSIAAIARQASKQVEDDGEVVISLR